MPSNKSFNGFVTRNGIGAPRKKKAEDDPGWDARKDGNKRGYYKGKWYGSPGPKVGKIPARRLRNTNSGRMPMP